MLLLEKENKRIIVSNYMLDIYLKNGWEVIKLIDNMPKAVSNMPVYKRSLVDLEDWYKTKLDDAKKHLAEYNKGLEFIRALKK